MLSYLKKIWATEATIRGATGILAITLTLSNVLGVIRDHYLAQKIPTNILDAYYAAFRLPDLIFNILILGAIASAFIPVFTSYIAKGDKKEAWKIANSVLNIGVLIVIILLLILFFLLPTINPLIVPNFDASRQLLTLKLTRVLLLSPLFFSLSYIFGGILNSFKKFIFYSLAPLFYNCAIIFGTIFFADKYGIWAVVWAVIIGAFLHWLIQVPPSFKLGWRYRSVFAFSHPAVKKIGRLMIPRSIGLGANQILLLIYTVLASGLPAGAIAVFNLANNIQTMPTVVFGNSVATAVFPALSESWALQEIDRFKGYFRRCFKTVFFFLLPSTIGLYLLRAQLIRLILGSGYFGWEQTTMAAACLGFFALSLIPQGLLPLFARSFYALHNTRTPMWAAIFFTILAIILGITLDSKMGVAGLALAFSIGSFLQIIYLYIPLSGRFPSLLSGLGSFTLRVFLASILMAIFIQGTKMIIGNYFETTGGMIHGWQVLAQAGAAIIIALLVYFGTIKFLKVEL
jgi:putative peptidoglycan lipid II flippase